MATEQDRHTINVLAYASAATRRAQQAEAAQAVLRDALVNLLEVAERVHAGDSVDAEHWFLIRDMARTAILTDAGAGLLAELDALRTVAEAAGAFVVDGDLLRATCTRRGCWDQLVAVLESAKRVSSLDATVPGRGDE